MAGHQCYHCKQWVDEGEAHDCWTTTEAALTADLSDDLREAWERLRDTAAELGPQRIYASHHSIMFARASCYAFVRPKTKYLELVIFLGREVKAPQVRRVDRASRLKLAHSIRITHRDEVEAPITDWLSEAYEGPAPEASAKKTRKKPSALSRPTRTAPARAARRPAKKAATAKRSKKAKKPPSRSKGR